MAKTMMRLCKLNVLLVLVAAAYLSGCITVKPTPGYARTGDIINVGLGGIKRNAGSQNLVPSDISVTITDANSVVHTPQVLEVYRVFPDHTSTYSVLSQDRNDSFYGDLVPHDGANWVTIYLTDDQGTPLPLATGAATVSITSAKLTQTFKSGEGTYASMPLEIVPGTGDFDANDDNQFQAYKSAGYLTIKPSVTPTVTLGGAQIEIVYTAALTSSHPIELRAVPLNHDPNSSVIQSITPNGDGTNTLKVFVTNPNGFVPVASWVQGQSTYDDLLLGITSYFGLLSTIPNANLSADFTVTANSFYVDTNGDIIAGLVPTLINELL